MSIPDDLSRHDAGPPRLILPARRPKWQWRWPFPRSPLTDPRSLASSLLVHGAVLVVASVAAIRSIEVAEPVRPSPALIGELEPTDNRAPSQEGGGGPGELGGESAEVAVERGTPARPTRDPAADELLSEILPRRAGSEAEPLSLPGPATSGLGLMPGPGTGGAGGSGGGSGGGIGKGTGPGTEFFGMRDRAGSYAYVIDCSGSMDARGSATASQGPLEIAKHELLASLARLPADALFGVVFYNLEATVFTNPQGLRTLMPAIPASKERVRTLLAGIQPFGGTNHMAAIQAAVALKPEVIFFLTDADMMTRQEADEIRGMVGKTRIQIVEFGIAGNFNGSAPLQILARATGGSYRYIDVRTFKK